MLATAYPTEGISSETHLGFWVIYLVSVALVLFGFIEIWKSDRQSSLLRKLAFAAILTGLIPLAWHLNLYRLDYHHFYQKDDSLVRPPIWQIVAIPILPLIGGVCLLFLKRKGSG